MDYRYNLNPPLLPLKIKDYSRMFNIKDFALSIQIAMEKMYYYFVIQNFNQSHPSYNLVKASIKKDLLNTE